MLREADALYLSGWGVYHPEGRLTNDDLVARLDTTHDWLESKVGILERRRAAPDETIADMGEIVARAALEQAGVHADDLDLVVGATSYDDMVVPASACRIGDRIATPAHAFDVKSACSGWLIGLDVADAFLSTGRADRALILAGEKSEVGVDPTDREGMTYFGDASVAGVVTRDRPAVGLEVLRLARSTNCSFHDAVEVPTGGWFRTDANRTRGWVVQAVAAMADELLTGAGLTPADLRALVCHQANLRLIEYIAASLDIEPDRHWHNVEWAGNTASAGAPSALFDGIAANRDSLRDGDLIMMITVGAGLNAMGTLLRWVAD